MDGAADVVTEIAHSAQNAQNAHGAYDTDRQGA